MTSMIDFMLDEERVASGIRLPLYDKDGNITDDWIQVRSMHSDEFQQALEFAQEHIRKDPSTDVEAVKLDAQIALIAGWSFDEECNIENTRQFMKAAPHIAERIDKAAGNNALFFPDAAVSSSTGQKLKSNSEKNPVGQKKLSAST